MHMLHISQKYKVILLASFALFLVVVFVGAYSGLIPTEIRAIPYYDSIGHFVLYGLLAFFATAAYQRLLKVGRIRIPMAIVIVSSIAVVDEFTQTFSTMRTFSYTDLGWGLFGVMVVWLLTLQGRKGR